MGIDIHTFVEFKNESGKWVSEPHMIRCDKCMISDECVYCNGIKQYDSLSVCDGIRAHPLEYVLDLVDREIGFPEDMSDEVRKFYKKDEEIGFIYDCHKCYKLSDLIKFDYKKYEYSDHWRVILFFDGLVKNMAEFSALHGGIDNVRLLTCYF